MTHQYEIVCDQLFILQTDVFIEHKLHNEIIIDNFIAMFRWALNRFDNNGTHNFKRQILAPAIFTALMTTCQTKRMLYEMK